MSIELGSKEFWDRVRNDPALLAYEVCQIDLANMEEALQRQAALRAWVLASYEGVKVDEETTKWELTKARAVALLAAKAVPDAHSGKPKTVAVLDAEVETAAAVQDTTRALLIVQRKRAALRAQADALGDRRDMLVQLAAKQRDESKEYGR